MTNAENDDNLEIYIAEPCAQAWDELPGDDKQRYCSKCALHVLFGPSFTRKEALRLVQNSTERVCMRLEFDAVGTARFKPEPAPAHAAVVRSSRWAATASAALLAACARTEPDVPSFAAPVVPEAIAPVEPVEPVVCHEPTVLDPLPADVPKRQAIPAASVATQPEVRTMSMGVTVVRGPGTVGGGVGVRRVQTLPTKPK